MAAWSALLTCWFGDSPDLATTLAEKHSLWFSKSTQQDEWLRQQFGELHQQACCGALAQWEEQAESRLALIILLDQLSRNLYRDQPHAFAQDATALSLAQTAIAQGMDQLVPLLYRVFYYLPLEHSEQLADQQQAVALFTGLQQQCAGQHPQQLAAFVSFTDFAKRHLQVIARFGRFPHRNAILGRSSSADEQQWLTQPGSGF
ncbi:DUF924 domain-containing protein [Pokkaliibacter plantistimulans]|uniref:DUF924 domain-containing protein n=1 Tax=Proteobacteria bacterium 228 TaxID=2083153 RepID=A0A2S5KT14_9PROT|nr:DUF924 family protein [Pokkaliibacter plantistimulans]PPC77795.1 DUF924 domain-containing protein [Pokkaliibacter plantistimulans]